MKLGQDFEAGFWSDFWSWTLAQILKLNLGTVFPQVIGAAQAEDKLNHVGALLRGKFDFKSDSQGEPCWKRDGNIKDFFRRTAKGKPRTGAWGRSPLPSECSWSRSTLKTCAVQITKSFLGGIKVASHFTFLKRGENEQKREEKVLQKEKSWNLVFRKWKYAYF